VGDIVAQNSGIVDDAADASEGCDRSFYDTLAGPAFGDTVVIGDCFTTFGDDLLGKLLRRIAALCLTRQSCSDVVDNNRRFETLHVDRDFATDAAAGAGDHGRLADVSPLP
jgi:hypothetical protein